MGVSTLIVYVHTDESCTCSCVGSRKRMSVPTRVLVFVRHGSLVPVFEAAPTHPPTQHPLLGTNHSKYTPHMYVKKQHSRGQDKGAISFFIYSRDALQG